jgi:hypothetical protein
MQQTSCRFAGTVLIVLTAALLAQAQWVKVAHAASGQVQHYCFNFSHQ